MVRRLLAWMALVAAMMAVVTVVPAAADVLGPCEGSVRIKGARYGPGNDTPGNPALLPGDEGVKVKFRGSTRLPITDYTGEIGVVLGPFTLPVVDWAGTNPGRKVRQRGAFDLDDAYGSLPFRFVGLYEVTGFHAGAEDRCDGTAFVKIEGNPLGTVPGITATVGTVAAAAGVVFAGVGKDRETRLRGRSVVGAIAGPLFGLFVAVDLQQWGLRALDNLSFFGLPLIGLLIGLAMAWWGPFGERPPRVPSARTTSAAAATAGTLPPAAHAGGRRQQQARAGAKEPVDRPMPDAPVEPERPPERRPPA